MNTERAYAWAWRLPSDPWGYRRNCLAIDSTGRLLRDLGNGWIQDTKVRLFTNAEAEDQLRWHRTAFSAYEIRLLPVDETGPP